MEAQDFSSLGAASLIDFAQLSAQADSWRPQFRQAQPVPHLIVDDFLAAEPLEQLISALENGPAQPVTGFRKLPNPVRELLWELNSGSAMRLLRQVTGIGSLIPDPRLLGGGLQRLAAGDSGTIPAPVHPLTGLKLCLSAQLCLSREWQSGWGGELALATQGCDITPQPGQLCLYLASAAMATRPIAGPLPLTRLQVHYYHSDSVQIGTAHGNR